MDYMVRIFPKNRNIKNTLFWEEISLKEEGGIRIGNNGLWN